MLQGQTLTCLILLMTIFKYVDNFEVFLSKTKDDKNQTIEQLTSFRNQSYQIPLFQIRYITIRTHSNDFHRNKHDNSNVIGFKFQVKSTNPEVVNIRKEVLMSRTNVTINNLNTILLEDLYILPRKKALSQIFNAYPSPTLIYPTTNDTKIDTLWSMESVTMNLTNVTFRLDILYDDDTLFSQNYSLNILVTQPKRRIDTIFQIMIPFIIISISVLMGVLLDTKEIIYIFKNPVPVLVGFVAQYGLMPFLAIAITKLFHYTPLNGLALFIIGCCPGSGASNQWTILFDGDVNLSAVMSFVSTIASFVMMPLYFYTLGRIYMDDLSTRVPFLHLARSLALVVIPYSIGIVISHFFPKSRPLVGKLIKPMMIILMLFFLTFGVVVNWYLFKMLDLRTALTAPLLPFVGFLFGALLAWISRMSWKHIKTIGIEAGIQNTGIAFVIMMYSFPQAVMVPLVVAFLTTKPFWVILIIRNQFKKYQQRKKLTEKSNNDEMWVISDDKPSLSNGKDHVAENMQQL